MGNCLITGTNRGLGLAFTKWACDQGYKVFASSRNEMPELSPDRKENITHIEADFSKPDNAVSKIETIVKDTPLDFVIHNAGLVDLEFSNVTVENAQDTLAINLITPIFLTKSLLPNIKNGQSKKVIFIGSVNGVDGNYCPAIFYAASRAGIRGVTQQLRTIYKEDKISFPLIEPGGMATDLDYDDSLEKALVEHDGERIPVQDLTKTMNWILSLSSAACPKEIILPNMTYQSV